jgi:hypothetical protein
MRSLTNRVLICSLLLTPSMLVAKPAKKKKAKPAAEQKAEPTEDLTVPPTPAAPANAAPVAAESTPPGKPTAGPFSHATTAGNYGMAGCGLGNYVVSEDSIVQIFAATTNSTGYQTIGMTLGTSNCKESGQSYAIEQRVFIDANLVSLKREAASGEGETLTAFAGLLGCDAAQFNQVSKSNFSSIYGDSEADAILMRYKAVLSDQCSRLI